MKDIEIIDYLLSKTEFLSPVKTSPIEISTQFSENSISKELLDEISVKTGWKWYLLNKAIYIER